MSLSDPYAPPDAGMPSFPTGGLLTTVDRWADAADGANEACLVVDAQAVIAAVSRKACELLGFAAPPDAIGQCLHAGVLPLVDFSPVPVVLPSTELGKIPPVQALMSKRLARGLIRVRCGTDALTIDAISTPLWEGQQVIGSLTFFCLV
jgi:hypothetical protein